MKSKEYMQARIDEIQNLLRTSNVIGQPERILLARLRMIYTSKIQVIDFDNQRKILST